jgi:acetyltransferase-like isoleucine patch superfamily enzyme
VKLIQVVREELLANFDGPALAGRLLGAPLPVGVGNRTRARLLRSCGLQIGEATTLAGPIRITGGRRASANLTIGRHCFINIGCLFDASETIDIGDGVALGQHVLMTTNSHALGHPDRRAGALEARPIRVGDGAWIATRAVLLPGVTVGDGAVVTAGAVVTRSIPAHTMAGGVPARHIKDLDPDSLGRPSTVT